MIGFSSNTGELGNGQVKNKLRFVTKFLSNPGRKGWKQLVCRSIYFLGRKGGEEKKASDPALISLLTGPLGE